MDSYKKLYDEIDAKHERIVTELREATRLNSLKIKPEDLHDAFNMMKQAFLHSPIAQAIVGFGGKLLFINDYLCETLGYRHEELEQMTFADITHPEDLMKDIEQFEKLKNGDIEKYELNKRYITKNGDEIKAHLKVRLIRNGKRPQFVVGYFLPQKCVTCDI